MRTPLATLAAIAASLVAAAPAAAVPQTELPAMLDAARAQAGPGCPALVVEFVDLREGTVGLGMDCRIQIDADWFAAAGWVLGCSAVAHEYTHAIGVQFDNPADPWHSGDPAHFMYPGLGNYAPACVTADPAAQAWDRFRRLNRRATRLDRRCVRLERLGWARADRCWRAASRALRAADRAWFKANGP
jgi:hypothetical protein